MRVSAGMVALPRSVRLRENHAARAWAASADALAFLGGGVGGQTPAAAAPLFPTDQFASGEEGFPKQARSARSTIGSHISAITSFQLLSQRYCNRGLCRPKGFYLGLIFKSTLPCLFVKTLAEVLRMTMNGGQHLAVDFAAHFAGSSHYGLSHTCCARSGDIKTTGGLLIKPKPNEISGP